MHEKKLKPPKHMIIRSPFSLPPRGCVKELSVPLRKRGGRARDTGRITVRHRGGGFKRRIRLVDTKRLFDDPYNVIRIEHDPNRSSKIALVQNRKNGNLAYILAYVGIKKGDVIRPFIKNEMSSEGQFPGQTMSLANVSIGTQIHNIENRPGGGGALVRSAGTLATLVGKENGMAIIKLPSKAMKKLKLECRATIGRVSNPDWHLRVIGKAGRNRNLGWRPTVRGVAMNAIDHPHGGGKGGKSKGNHSQSPWGKICK